MLPCYYIRADVLDSKSTKFGTVLVAVLMHIQCRLYLHWGPGHPQPNGAPR